MLGLLSRKRILQKPLLILIIATIKEIQEAVSGRIETHKMRNCASISIKENVPLGRVVDMNINVTTVTGQVMPVIVATKKRR